MDMKKDRDIAEHVLEMHRYVRPGHENIPETETFDVSGEEREDKNEVFVKDFGVHGSEGKILTTSFLKKYIDYAKTKKTDIFNALGKLYCGYLVSAPIDTHVSNPV